MSFIHPDRLSVTLSPVFTDNGLCAFMRATPVKENGTDQTSVQDILSAQPHLAAPMVDLFVAQLMEKHQLGALPIAVRLPHLGTEAVDWCDLFSRLEAADASFLLELDGTGMLAAPVEAASLIAAAKNYNLDVYAVADTTADMRAFTLLGAKGLIAGDMVFTAKPVVM